VSRDRQASRNWSRRRHIRRKQCGLSHSSPSLRRTVGAAITGTAWAHHGWEAYDAAKQQKVTGTIAELKWEQPHAFCG
jgi:hypothetical protein